MEKRLEKYFKLTERAIKEVKKKKNSSQGKKLLDLAERYFKDAQYFKKKGDTINIVVDYSDNIEVTNAQLLYKKVSDSMWISKPIINGSVELAIESNKNIYYYGNNGK